jgi:hypothetical protein
MDVSEKFIQGAVLMLADEFKRFNDGLTFEDSVELSEKVMSRIDWENEALMHKGLGWIAKNYSYV